MSSSTKHPAQIFAHPPEARPDATPSLRRGCRVTPELMKMVDGTEMAFYIDRKAGAAAGRCPVLTRACSKVLPHAARAGRESCRLECPYLVEDTPRGGSSSPRVHRSGDTLRPLHSLWIDLLVMRLLTAPQPGQKPVWFVIDELASLQRLPQLHTAITENRKSKNPLHPRLPGEGAA